MNDVTWIGEPRVTLTYGRSVIEQDFQCGSVRGWEALTIEHTGSGNLHVWMRGDDVTIPVHWLPLVQRLLADVVERTAEA